MTATASPPAVSELLAEVGEDRISTAAGLVVQADGENTGAHYWERELGKLGHTVRLVSPQFVRPM